MKAGAPERQRNEGTRVLPPLACLLACFFAAGAYGLSAAPEPSQAHAGRPLADILLSFQSQGLTVVFTSELVRPEMRVATEPAARDPRQALDEVLAPFGLAAQEGPGSVLVVVARPPAAPAPPAAPDEARQTGAVAGEVRAARSGEGVAGAVVRVLEAGKEGRTADGGTFTVPALAPGGYSLEVSAPGFLTQRVGGVAVPAGGVRHVLFLLQPEPVFRDEILVQSRDLSLAGDHLGTSLHLGREEIDHLPNLGGDAVRLAAGQPGTAGNDSTAQLSVHGGRRDEVEVRFDGQELYDAFHLKDYDNALSIVPASSVAGARLTTGALPASQGDRMSGVLDLRTAEPAAGHRTTLGLSLLNASAASAGTFAGDRGGWGINARRGFLELAGDAMNREGPQFWDVAGKVEVAAGRGGRLSAHGLVAGDALDQDKTGADNFERLQNHYRSTYGWLRHESDPAARLRVETAGSWARIRRDRDGEGAEGESGYELQDRRDLDVAALSQTWSLGTDPQRLAWGWELRRYDARFDYARDLRPDMEVLAPFSAPREPSFRFQGDLAGAHTGLWASDHLSLFGDRLAADVGGRFDRHTASDDRLLSPRAAVAWKVGERGVVRGSWGRFFQSQRPYELQVEDGETRLWRAEKAVHTSLGYEHLFPPSRPSWESLRVQIFHRDIASPRPRYENLLSPLDIFHEIESDRVRIAPESSRADGLEVLVRGRRGAGLGWWLAWSYSRVTDRLAGETVPRSLDQPHTVSLGLACRLPRQWSLDLLWQYHTGWPTTPVTTLAVADPEDPDEADLVPVFGALNSRRLPVYHRLDLRASRSRDLPSGRWTTFVEIRNLYDRRNARGYDLDLDESGVVLRQENWLGIVPSLGVVWSF